jgi:hypothetical protein
MQMYDHKPEPGLTEEEDHVKGLLRTNMQAAVDRLREDADHFPYFNQMAKDLYYGKTPDVGATVIIEPILGRHVPEGEKYVEVWNQHVLDGKSETVTVAYMDDRGNHHSIRR